jgi:hypothetical protein
MEIKRKEMLDMKYEARIEKEMSRYEKLRNKR